MYIKTASLSLAVAAALFAVPALADETDDRFTLRIGAMSADGSGDVSARSRGLEENVSFSEDYDFGSSEISPRFDGVFRFSPRNRLIFDYFKYDKDDSETLDEDVVYGDLSIPAGSRAKAEVEFQLASLIYDFSVIDTPQFSMGLQIGGEWAKIEGKASANTNAERFAASESADGYAPVVGLRFSGKPGEKWLLSAQAQYVDAGWGDFDWDGKIKRANAIVEYRFVPNFGVFAGYDWFKIEYDDSGSDASGNLDLEFKGPMAGITWAF